MQKEYELQMKARILKDLELRKERTEKLKEIETKLLQKYKENAPLFVGVNAAIEWFENENLLIIKEVEKIKSSIDDQKLSKLSDVQNILSEAIDRISKEANSNPNSTVDRIEPIKLKPLIEQFKKYSTNKHIYKAYKSYNYIYEMYQMLENFMPKLIFNKASMVLNVIKNENIVDNSLDTIIDILIQISNIEQERTKHVLSLCDSSHLLTLIDGEYYCHECKHMEEDIEKLDKKGRLIINYDSEWFNRMKRDRVIGTMFSLNYITNFVYLDSYRHEFTNIVNSNILEGKDAYEISHILHKKYNINMFTYKG
jgi:hypothetical protein